LARHDHAVQAEAALRGLLFDEGLLYGNAVFLGEVPSPSRRGDLGSLNGLQRGSRQEANRLTLDDDRAGSALA